MVESLYPGPGPIEPKDEEEKVTAGGGSVKNYSLIGNLSLYQLRGDTEAQNTLEELKSKYMTSDEGKKFIEKEMNNVFHGREAEVLIPGDGGKGSLKITREGNELIAKKVMLL